MQILISAESEEFSEHRGRIRKYIPQHLANVLIQEDFLISVQTTLVELDNCIRECDLVVHLVGERAGKTASRSAVDALLHRYRKDQRFLDLIGKHIPDPFALSYTQWEGLLTAFHGRDMLTLASTALVNAIPSGGPKEPEGIKERVSQRNHLQRLRALNRWHEAQVFSTIDQVITELLARLARIFPSEKQRPRNIDPSIGHLFKGRGKEMSRVRRLVQSNGQTKYAAMAVTLTGPGGVGKTRLATEYGTLFANEHTALLKVKLASRVALRSAMAALTKVLGLPASPKGDEQRDYENVLHWLNDDANSGWLLVIDGADTDDAITGVVELLPQLGRGLLLITTRIGHWPMTFARLPLGLLSKNASVDLLLEATSGLRARMANTKEDQLLARSIARDLGYLALGLTQASATINAQAWSLERYHEEWSNNRANLLDDPSYDPRITGYDHNLAAMWITSYEQLNESGRRLLEAMAWLSDAPVPDAWLRANMNTVIPNIDSGRLQLIRYSLIHRVEGREAFRMHKLSQELERMRQRQSAIYEARVGLGLAWVHEIITSRLRSQEDAIETTLLTHVKEILMHAEAISPTDHVPNLPTVSNRLRELLAEHPHHTTPHPE